MPFACRSTTQDATRNRETGQTRSSPDASPDGQVIKDHGSLLGGHALAPGCQQVSVGQFSIPLGFLNQRERPFIEGAKKNRICQGGSTAIQCRRLTLQAGRFRQTDSGRPGAKWQ